MFIKLFQNLIIRDLINNPLAYLVSVTGIALGVAIILAIDMTSLIAKSEFSNNISQFIKNSNLEISDRTFKNFKYADLPDLNWLWDYDASFTSEIESPCYINQDKNILTTKLIGIDFSASHNIEQIKNSTKNADLFTALLNPKNCLISSSLANLLKVKANCYLNIIINHKLKKIHVIDIVKNNENHENYILQDLACAQELLESPNYISKIFLKTANENLNPIKDKLKQDLPANFIAQNNVENFQQNTNMLKSFNSNLQSLGFISLLVGVFLMYNTMTNAIIRHRTNISILRLLGLQHVTIASLFLTEALFLAIIGSVLGIVLGYFMSGTLLGMIGKTLEHFYLQDGNQDISINNFMLVKSFSLGLIASFIASIIPISETFSISPALALKTSSYETRVLGLKNQLGLIGTILILLAGQLANLSLTTQNTIFGYISALLLILGFVLLIPLCLFFITQQLFLKIYTFCLGLEGSLAAKILRGTSYRSSIAIASIMTSLALVVSLNIMITSFRTTVTLWLEQTLKADIYLEPKIRSLKNSEFSEKLITEFNTINGISAIDGFISSPLILNGKITNLAGADLNVLKTHGQLCFLNNRNTNDVMQYLNSESAIISQCLAKKFQLTESDNIYLPTAIGIKKFKIIGIYYDYASDLGYIVINRNVYAKCFNNNNLTSMAIYLKPNANINQIKQALEQILIKYPFLEIKTNKDLKTNALRIFDRTFAVTYLLNTIATTIAMFTVANVLYALIIESNFEYTLMYCLGLGQNRLAKIILSQSLIMSMLGGLMGIALGYILALLLIYVINDQSFGWTIFLKIPYNKIIYAYFLITLMVLITTIMPIKILPKKISSRILNQE